MDFITMCKAISLYAGSVLFIGCLSLSSYGVEQEREEQSQEHLQQRFIQVLDYFSRIRERRTWKCRRVFSEGKVINILEVFQKIYRQGHIKAFDKVFLKLDPVLHRLDSEESHFKGISMCNSLIVVGDIHGSLSCLMSILRQGNLENDSFLFLGDYVDRGPNSVECFLLLAVLKVEFPENFFLLRGNHETTEVNGSEYGRTLFAELKEKYPRDVADSLFVRFSQAFDRLPVMILLEAWDTGKRVIAAHGGPPFFETSTDLMEKLDYLEQLDPDDLNVATEFNHVYWLDPDEVSPEEIGLSYFRHSEERGAGGYEFTQNATALFLAHYDASLLLRGHSHYPEGYRLQHENRVCTIHSAEDRNTQHGYLFLRITPDDHDELVCRIMSVRKEERCLGAVKPKLLKEFTLTKQRL